MFQKHKDWDTIALTGATDSSIVSAHVSEAQGLGLIHGVRRRGQGCVSAHVSEAQGLGLNGGIPDETKLIVSAHVSEAQGLGPE